MFKWVPDGAPEPFRKPLGVAIIAAGGDFRAPRDGVPRCVGPLDRAGFGHSGSPEQTQNMRNMFACN